MLRMLCRPIVVFLLPLLAACGESKAAPPPDSTPTMPVIEATAARTHATPTAAPDAKPEVTPRAAAPDAQQILRDGETVPFRLCSRTTDWQRPGLGEMRSVLTNPRFGDGKVPEPTLYSLYLSHFYYKPVPAANSANAEANAFGGFWSQEESAITSVYCEQDSSVYRSADWQMLEAVGYHIVGMRRAGNSLVVRAEPALGTWEAVMFPYPQPEGLPEKGSMFLESIQVVGLNGTILHEELRIPGVTGYQWIEWDESGQLLYAVIWGGSETVVTSGISIGSRAGKYRIVPSAGIEVRPNTNSPSFKPITAGTLIIRDSGQTIDLPAQPSPWEGYATIELPAGEHQLEFEMPGGTTQARWLILREDQPVPE